SFAISGMGYCGAFEEEDVCRSSEAFFC
ncbi:hypothetical protein A2U01_0071442, partial [Trifolium medium]|nr:hypothetical protein [Trifolium medium]